MNFFSVKKMTHAYEHKSGKAEDQEHLREIGDQRQSDYGGSDLHHDQSPYLQGPTVQGQMSSFTYDVQGQGSPFTHDARLRMTCTRFSVYP
jgi:hypothetical protein